MKYFSISAISISFLIVLIFAAYYPKWNQSGQEVTIAYDVSGYYIYLPAIFIYHDIRQFEFYDDISKKYNSTKEVLNKLPDGRLFTKYPAGAAVCYSPFFFIAHGIASVTAYPADGYSRPYQMMIGLGCLLYSFLGIFMLRKILLQYFNDVTTGITLLLIVVATNYLNYAAIDQAMTHSMLFTIYTAIIWFTIRFYKAPSVKYAILLGFLCGLATIIRPTEIISVLIPAAWGLAARKDVKERIYLHRHKPRYIISFVLIAFLTGLIQLIYWKTVTGNYIFYSYQQEGFEWLHPHVIQVFFSYRKGWFLYTPVMLLIIPGFYHLYKHQKELFATILIFTIINMYIIVSWWCWWYGGSLGQRSLVQSYAILSFPLAAVVNAVLRSAQWKKMVFLIFTAFCSWYNINLTQRAHSENGGFESEHMNRTYFQSTFGKLNVPLDSKKYLDTNERHRGKRTDVTLIYSNDMEADTLHVNTNSMIGGKKSLFVNKENQFTTPYAVPLPPAGSEWLSISADFRFQYKEWSLYNMTQFIIRFKNNDQVVKQKFIRIQRIMKEGEFKTLSYDVRIPETKYNQIDFYLWNADSETEVFMDNVRVESFK